MGLPTVWPLSSLIVLLSLCMSLLSGCDTGSKSDLPVLGKVTQEFRFLNQDNQEVTLDIFNDKIYITDFFFTTCPSICPIMKRQMTRVYDEFKDNPEILLFSHTIDPDHDTVEVLKKFADGLGVATEKWQMVTGDQDDIFAMAKHYMLGAMKNEEVPGGYIHSGHFVLVDKNRNIRGYYNGTETEAVDKLISDLKEFIGE